MPKTLQNGSFVDANGTAVANGTLVLTLSQDAQIIAGGNVNARDLIAITLDSNGKVTGSPSVYGQDELNPGGTFYFAEVLNSGGSSVWGQTKWVISGASPINLDLMVPTLLNPDPAYSQPVLQNPTGNQTINVYDLLPSINLSQNLGSATKGWRFNGAVATYKGVSVVRGGVPAIYAGFDPITQTAAIGSTTLYTPVNAGFYRVSVYLKVTTAAGTSSTLGPVTIAFTPVDGVAQSNVMQLSTVAGASATSSGGNSTTTSLNGSLTLYSIAAVPITYAVGYASNAANVMTYEFRIRCEALDAP